MTAAEQQRKLATIVPAAGIAVVVLCPWVLYLLKRLAGIDPIIGAKDDPAGLVYLYAGIGLVVVGPIVAWVVIKRNLYLLDHGILVEGRIGKSGLWGTNVVVWNHPSVPVTFLYTVEGKEYSKRKDVPKPIAEKYTAETRIEIRVDPKNPNRCLIFD